MAHEYLLTFTNGSDRTINVSGDSLGECVKNLKEMADWNSWLNTLKEFNYTPEEIEEEIESGFYYHGD